MPYKAAHGCAWQGCPALTHTRYCAEHAQQVAAKFDAERGSSARRGYGRRWRKLRKMVLARDPVCKLCRRAPSTNADHIVPRAKGGPDTFENLQGLCHECHSRKTATEDGGFGKASASNSSGIVHFEA